MPLLYLALHVMQLFFGDAGSYVFSLGSGAERLQMPEDVEASLLCVWRGGCEPGRCADRYFL